MNCFIHSLARSRASFSPETRRDTTSLNLRNLGGFSFTPSTISSTSSTFSSSAAIAVSSASSTFGFSSSFFSTSSSLTSSLAETLSLSASNRPIMSESLPSTSSFMSSSSSFDLSVSSNSLATPAKSSISFPCSGGNSATSPASPAAVAKTGLTIGITCCSPTATKIILSGCICSMPACAHISSQWSITSSGFLVKLVRNETSSSLLIP